MLSVNKTEAMQLNQWQSNEYLKIDDFNSDNLKIDNKFKDINTQLSEIMKYPACRVYNNANISIPNATYTALQFNSEDFDTDNMHDNTTNNTRLTCKTAGIYLITGSVSFMAIQQELELVE